MDMSVLQLQLFRNDSEVYRKSYRVHQHGEIAKPRQGSAQNIEGFKVKQVLHLRKQTYRAAFNQYQKTS